MKFTDAHFRFGRLPCGPSIMKFTLTFDGDLPSTGNGGSRKALKKWEVKKHFDPQLRELWDTHPSLVELKRNPTWPITGAWRADAHHSYNIIEDTPRERKPNEINLIEPIVCAGRSFVPLVRSSLALHCGLKILFLRKETPGKIYQGGDIDNRIKTLLDALCAPNDPCLVIKDDTTINDPIFCLVEDDALISSLSIDTQTLLTGQGANVASVRLVIEVDVRVAQSRAYNSLFLS